ncbi:MAG: hypothetical protein Q4B10_06165 [Actinomycetaceae bacterium]|nr:hypothetical protein [Actinomycetaceae bacterium]
MTKRRETTPRPDVEIVGAHETLRASVIELVELGGWTHGPGGRVSIGVGQAADLTVGARAGVGIDAVLPGDEEDMLLLIDEALAGERAHTAWVRGLCGGAGATSIAAGLAARLARRGRTAVVDVTGTTDLEAALGIGRNGARVTAGTLANRVADELPRWNNVSVVTTSDPESTWTTLGCAFDWVVADAGRAPAPTGAFDIACALPTPAAQAALDRGATPDLLLAPPGLATSVARIDPRGLRAAARATGEGYGPIPAASRSWSRTLARIEAALRGDT